MKAQPWLKQPQPINNAWIAAVTNACYFFTLFQIPRNETPTTPDFFVKTRVIAYNV